MTLAAWSRGTKWQKLKYENYITDEINEINGGISSENV